MFETGRVFKADEGSGRNVDQNQIKRFVEAGAE
jgi:hypothetical protein